MLRPLVGLGSASVACLAKFSLLSKWMPKSLVESSQATALPFKFTTELSESMMSDSRQFFSLDGKFLQQVTREFLVRNLGNTTHSTGSFLTIQKRISC